MDLGVEWPIAMFDGREFCLFEVMEPFLEEIDNKRIDTIALGGCCFRFKNFHPSIYDNACFIQDFCQQKGIELIVIEEHFTSQTCLFCNSRRKPDDDRFFRCPNCLIEFDRDLLGAANIFRKVIGTFPAKASKLIPTLKEVSEKLIKPRRLKKEYLPRVIKEVDDDAYLFRRIKMEKFSKKFHKEFDLEEEMRLNREMIARLKRVYDL